MLQSPSVSLSASTPSFSPSTQLARWTRRAALVAALLAAIVGDGVAAGRTSLGALGATSPRVLKLSVLQTSTTPTAACDGSTLGALALTTGAGLGWVCGLAASARGLATPAWTRLEAPRAPRAGLGGATLALQAWAWLTWSQGATAVQCGIGLMRDERHGARTADAVLAFYDCDVVDHASGRLMPRPAWASGTMTMRQPLRWRGLIPWNEVGLPENALEVAGNDARLVLTLPGGAGEVEVPFTRVTRQTAPALAAH
jgi:hypothetical protein